MRFDICIIGAGPAGLMAADAAAQNAGLTVVVMDGNSIAGRKLLLTGGGRCNLTHDSDVKDMLRAYGSFSNFLRFSLYEFSPDKVREFFRTHRLDTNVPQKNGCVFPITNRAADVARVLTDSCRRKGVRFMHGKLAEAVKKVGEEYSVKADGKEIFCKALIIATGGVTWPHTGSRGDGYGFARAMGHTVEIPKAALVGLITEQQWVRKLQGVSLEHVKITALLGDGKAVSEGPMLFTQHGLGGPAVLDLSRELADTLGGEEPKPVDIFIDLVPEMDVWKLEQHIIELCDQSPKKELAAVINGMVPRSLAVAVTDQLESRSTLVANQVTKPMRKALVKLMKYLPLQVIGTRSIAEATVTRGGIDTDEVDDKTMESKLSPGLFFAGEVLNVDGPCGGYNLQICWSTGRTAGSAAARSLAGARIIQEVKPKSAARPPLEAEEEVFVHDFSNPRKNRGKESE